MIVDSLTWCVVHTQPLKEMVAQQHLQDQGFEVYIPRFKKLRKHARKIEEVLAPLFPRYLFVGMNKETAPWRSIRGTRGVSYLLMANDNKPAYISSETIHDLKAREDTGGCVNADALTVFIKGDKVRIRDGAFQDQVALFEGLSDKNRVDLLLNFLGREMRVSVPTYAVEAA